MCLIQNTPTDKRGPQYDQRQKTDFRACTCLRHPDDVGATFVSTKVLLTYFLPVELLFTRVVLAFLALLLFYPHHLKLKDPRQELTFAGAGLFGLVLYFMLENTALTMTYASNVGIIVACAPFFVAVMVGFFFPSEKSGANFYIGFIVAIAGVILISMSGQKT